MIISPPKHCSCNLPEGHYGSGGFHFYIPKHNQCWLGPEDEGYSPRYTVYQQPLLDKPGVVKESCRCTYKIYHNGRLTEKGPKPHCKYSDRFLAVAYERCPHYEVKKRLNREDSLRDHIRRNMG